MVKQVMQGHLRENTSDTRRGRKVETDNLDVFVLHKIISTNIKKNIGHTCHVTRGTWWGVNILSTFEKILN